MSFSVFLKDQMEKQHLTQGDLSRMTGLDKSSVSKHVSGELNPKRATVVSYAKALKVSEDVALEAANFIAIKVADEQIKRVPNKRLIALMERIDGLEPAQQIVAVDTIDAFVTSIQRITSKASGTIGRGEDPHNLVLEDITDDESKFEE